MNYRMVAFVLGRIFAIEAGLMLFPLICAMLYGEWYLLPAFLLPAALLAVLGFITSRKTPKNTTIFARDGLAIVALVWVLMSAFGALPFVISGEIPSFIDAFFETVSGFTTTGSTILTDVEALSHGTLYWRSFSHWVGGMGVLVFAMAVLPMTDGRAMHLMRAEIPGPTVGKISSKLSDSAKILYAIYFAMTFIEVVLLCAGGMPLFDSLIHTFGTAGTGGFSNKGLSVGAYNNPYFEIVIGVFMLLFGINFNVYFFLLIRHFKEAFACEEMRVYLGVIAASTLAVAGNIFHLYGNVWQSLRYSFFQVASIITTTGYATTDFNMWPTFSKAVLVLLMFSTQIYGPILAILSQLTSLFHLETVTNRMRTLLTTPAMEGEDKDVSKYDIELKNVTFGYNQDDVIKDVSFSIPAGSVTALVGPSGSGKSTISKLIARFWDVRKGQISIGGMDVRTIEPEHLMRCMSFVFQDVTLFNDTVFNNIRVGNMNATEEQVMAAAKAAYCDEFIQRLPDGYQTVLGENGSTLSGGERQRISIARALLKDAPIILLDEATASLDPENEVLIQRAIAKLVEGKTVIMIAHRLRTVVDADQILVLDNGRLVEHGTHDELMKKNGLYHKLFHIQQESLGWAV